MSSKTLPPQIKRRIFKEIEQNNLNAELFDNNILYVFLDLKNSQIKDIILVFRLENYPFVAPTINYIINNKEENMGNIYKTGYIFLKEMKNITGYECLCCSSYLCGYNWVPTNKIIDIIKEFIMIVGSKYRVVEKLYCDKIQDQLIKSVSLGRLPLEDIKISDYL